MKIYSVYNKKTKSHIAFYKNKEQLNDWSQGGALRHVVLFACTEKKALWFVRFLGIIAGVLFWILIKNTL